MKKNLSAIKRDHLSLRNRFRNKFYKLAIKTSVKKYLIAIKNSQNIDSVEITNCLSLVYKKVDKAVKKGIIHKNKAARKKSRLAKLLYKNVSI